MGKRILTDVQIDQACEWREEGQSYGQIVRRFAAQGLRISEGSISWLCLINGADVPPAKRQPGRVLKPGMVVQRGGHVVRTFTAEEDSRLLALEAEGLKLAEVARRLGRPRNSVVGRLATLARQEARAEP